MIYVDPAANKVFEKAPEGQHLAVLADVVDLGEVATPWGSKHKVMLVWQTEEKDSEGQPYRLFKRFSLSMHAKASLYAAVKDILGDVPRDEEDKPVRFALDSLIGKNSNLVVKHETGTDGKVYARIAAILRVKKDTLRVSADFVRKQDQPAKDIAAFNNRFNAQISKTGAAATKKTVTTATISRPPKAVIPSMVEMEPSEGATDFND